MIRAHGIACKLAYPVDKRYDLKPVTYNVILIVMHGFKSNGYIRPSELKHDIYGGSGWWIP